MNELSCIIVRLLALRPGDGRAEQRAGGTERGKLQDVSTRLTGITDHNYASLCASCTVNYSRGAHGVHHLDGRLTAGNPHNAQ